MKKVKKIWMRMGDSDDYHDFDDPYEAGYELGNYLAETGSRESDVRGIRWQSLGLEAGGFTGYNYISLFWGDEDAQKARELTRADKAQFVAGIYEGSGFKKPTPVLRSKSTKKSKIRKKSVSTAPTSMRGIRR